MRLERRLPAGSICWANALVSAGPEVSTAPGCTAVGTRTFSAQPGHLTRLPAKALLTLSFLPHDGQAKAIVAGLIFISVVFLAATGFLLLSLRKATTNPVARMTKKKMPKTAMRLQRAGGGASGAGAIASFFAALAGSLSRR